MIESFIYFLPLLILLLGIFALFSLQQNHNRQHSCFRVSRIFITISYILQIIFYNKPLIFGITEGNSFTILFISFIYCGAVILLYLSRKWYAAMNISGYLFCRNILMSLLLGSLLIASTNLALTFVCCILMLADNYVLLKSVMQKNIIFSRGIYMFMAVLCATSAVIALIYLYHQIGSLMYGDLYSFFNIHTPNALLYISLCCLTLLFIFLSGASPMHFWFTETAGANSLPISAYFVLLPLGAYFGGFVQLNIKVLMPIMDFFVFFYSGIALLSIGVGAIGACSSQNLRKTFAFITIYNLGIILLILQHFTPYALHSAFIWMFAYLIAICGIYVSLFGLKIKGEYLFVLNELSGAGKKRPFVAATMLIFMFSLLGFPPLIGFIGTLNALNTLAFYKQFYTILYVLLMMLLIAYALLPIIKTTWFDESKNNFDRVDISIYILLWINIFFMLFLVIKPHFLMNESFEMLKVVFE